MMATAAAVAFIVYSCKSKLSEAERLDLSVTPLQVVDSMYILQTTSGRLDMRVEAPVMERYDTDSMSYELFPQGLDVYGYTEQGELQSEIHSENAAHEKYKKSGNEIWKAFGNVIMRNVLKDETMETDTIYWDRTKGEIYTDCYVRMYSPSGFIQGYGMRTDEKVTRSTIMRPFNSYGVVVQDSTEVRIDSANFIGPLLRK
ncbi:MAG: LPS export ABC transporter periplasmic protein LptC [Bacteroidales bacterium]|nr:LPS export ABC transporter periplasmic protein LptC [Bacteroidales bacterium]